MLPSLKFTAIAADLHAEPLGDRASHYLFGIGLQSTVLSSWMQSVQVP